MKLFILLALCAIGTAATGTGKEVLFENLSDVSPEDRRPTPADILIQQMINYVRHVIKSGSYVFGFPPLDPLELDQYYLRVPTEVLYLDLDLKNATMLGLGDFVVHNSYLRLRDLCLYIDASIPKLHISTEVYNLAGDFLTALPLYGNGKAVFEIEHFRIQGNFYLKRSRNRRSVLIDRIEHAAFQLPLFRSNLDGVIGGGDIDAIVNALIDEVIIEYVKRFEGVISKIGSEFLVEFANPYLNQLDTWKYIEWLFQ